MKLAVVTGYVVCTVRHEGLAHDKLLMVEMLNARGEPDGQCAVAIDIENREFAADAKSRKELAREGYEIDGRM
ncbi:EutN/CcmL family microcompartment protein, partial [Klebsiella pneumoniae]|uniref:EutN/CcmL family microcompartment protein n=1 Tax=Klebsiella pneumoniae TaxID=573 RepID=UPI002E794959